MSTFLWLGATLCCGLTLVNFWMDDIDKATLFAVLCFQNIYLMDAWKKP